LQPHVRFYAGHPLVSATGHAVGTLCLFDVQPRTFSAVDRKMLTELGGWVETELNHSQEMERAAEVQRALVPRPGAVHVPGYKIEGTCLPARSVGGDLVDWFVAPDGDVVPRGRWSRRRSGSTGFARNSAAPARMATTAWSNVAWPESTTTTGSSG